MVDDNVLTSFSSYHGGDFLLDIYVTITIVKYVLKLPWQTVILFHFLWHSFFLGYMDAGYSSGISGFLFMFVLDSKSFDESASSIIFLFIKFLLFNIMFIFTYKMLPFVLSIIINVLLTLWGLLFGVFWLIAAMQ